MNLFQKDLSVFQDEMAKNRELYKTVKEEIEKKRNRKNKFEFRNL